MGRGNTTESKKRKKKNGITNRSSTNSFLPNPSNPQEKNTKTTTIIKVRPNSATAAVR
jgi:hypothetical protein